MSTGDPSVTTAGERVRQCSHHSDIGLTHPVPVINNGRPRTVLLSVEEYPRLKPRDPWAFYAADTPEPFLPDSKRLVRGGAASPVRRHRGAKR
jgi:hypothetical protein